MLAGTDYTHFDDGTFAAEEADCADGIVAAYRTDDGGLLVGCRDGCY